MSVRTDITNVSGLLVAIYSTNAFVSICCRIRYWFHGMRLPLNASIPALSGQVVKSPLLGGKGFYEFFFDAEIESY